MNKRQAIITILSLLASNILLFVLYSTVTMSAQTFVIIGWSLIALQVLATVILFTIKKQTAATIGLVWVGAAILIQLIPWSSLVRR